MSATTEIATVGISTVALALSIYGVWEKRRDTRRQLQIRLSEIVDELNAVALEQQKESRETDSPELRIAYNARRELLCREGVAIADVLGPQVTDSDYRFLGVALDRVGDRAGADVMWDKAVAAAPRDSVFRVFVLRGYARRLFVHGQEQRGRGLFEEALQLSDGDSDEDLWTAGETLLAWARSERDAGGPKAEIGRLIDEAERRFDRLRFGPRRQVAMSLVAGTRTVGADDAEPLDVPR